MSEALDQETQTHQTAIQKGLDVALRLAEQARIKVKTDPCPNGGGFAAFADDNLSAYAYDLKPPYFLALVWQTGTKFLPDPEDGRSLKNCQAWILKYDSHYAKWKVKAWNIQIGNKPFAKLARRLATE
jgi:hypothetical protein